MGMYSNSTTVQALHGSSRYRLAIRVLMLVTLLAQLSACGDPRDLLSNFDIRITLHSLDKDSIDRKINSDIDKEIDNSKKEAKSNAQENLHLTPEKLALFPGQTRHLRVKSIANDGSEKDITNYYPFVWHSSDDTIAQVDEKGKVTAIGLGIAQISASHDGVTKSSTVTVNDTSVSTILISPDNTVSSLVGKSHAFSATAVYTDGSAQLLAPQDVVWSSSDDQVVSIDVDGLANSHAEGEALISAEHAGVLSTATVVSVAGVLTLDTISVEPSVNSLLVGESLQLTATGFYTDGSVGDMTEQVVWTASNPGVVSFAFDKPGLITAERDGTTSITVIHSSGATTAQAVIDVIDVSGGAVTTQPDLDTQDVDQEQDRRRR